MKIYIYNIFIYIYVYCVCVCVVCVCVCVWRVSLCLCGVDAGVRKWFACVVYPLYTASSGAAGSAASRAAGHAASRAASSVASRAAGSGLKNAFVSLERIPSRSQRFLQGSVRACVCVVPRMLAYADVC